MRTRSRIATATALLLAVTALAALSIVLTPRTEAKPPGGGGGGGGGTGRCECANLDAPVICDGGKVYPNPCVAACVHATNCVPYGDGGQTAAIRYCCTPQQSAACAAKGGTTSCRTGVCQCLF